MLKSALASCEGHIIYLLPSFPIQKAEVGQKVGGVVGGMVGGMVDL